MSKLKKLVKRILHKLLGLIKYILRKLKDPVNIVIYVVVVIIFFSPCIIGYAYTFVTHRPKGAAIATAYWLFWAGPVTPAMPIQFAITFALSKPIHKLIHRYKRKHGAKWL